MCVWRDVVLFGSPINRKLQDRETLFFLRELACELSLASVYLANTVPFSSEGRFHWRLMLGCAFLSAGGCKHSNSLQAGFGLGLGCRELTTAEFKPNVAASISQCLFHAQHNSCAIIVCDLLLIFFFKPPLIFQRNKRVIKKKNKCFTELQF